MDFERFVSENTDGLLRTAYLIVWDLGAMANAQVQIPAGRIQLMASRRTDRDGRSYSFAEGHTGAGVSAVELMLDDGTSVDATVANGWFVAWWPSAHQVSSADITTPTGVKTQTFHFPRAPQPAGGKDSGSSIVSGAGNGTREGFSSSR